jgi:CRP/FNR family transcriptional regulator
MAKVNNGAMSSLKNISLFQDLSAAELKPLQRHLKEGSFVKGEMLFSESDPCEQIIIVRSGRVKVFRTSSEGREQILEVLEAGNTCACNPGVKSWCCSASAQALTSANVWFLPRTHYNQLIKNNHKMTQKLNQIFAERLCRFSSLLEGVSLDNPQRRLVKFILDMLSDESTLASKGASRAISFTHEEISMRLGLVRETVTRHLRQLKEKGFIDIHPRKITVLDQNGLKKLL